MHHSYLDKFASMDSPVHRLDPRVKTLTVGVFIGFVVSVGRRVVLGLVPFALSPGILVAVSGVPAGYLLRRIAITSPLLLSLAILPPSESRWRRLIELLKSFEVTLLIASHDLEMVIKRCERCILIDNGRIIADFPARELLSDAPLLEAHGLEKPWSLRRSQE